MQEESATEHVQPASRPADVPLDVQLKIQQVAKRMGCDTGERILEFRLRDGELAVTYVHHGPIRNEELARLTRTDPEHG